MDRIRSEEYKAGTQGRRVATVTREKGVTMTTTTETPETPAAVATLTDVLAERGWAA